MSKRMSPRKAVIESFMKVCGDDFCSSHGVDRQKMRKILSDNVYTGEEDPGQWAPTAPVVVHNESFAGYWASQVDALDTLIEVEDLASVLCGESLFAQAINSAVMAFYPI